ncbi:hypothetical protein CRG98_029907 [Punica granatum]|uniref:CCHC-type domain-containing protein n=1 Tax=Punica granatum TaxID=22663 RepID=A0A2I0J0B4_PUNGR|nr:hypothetical protein CRG98_029907 [Punica granatum]
MATNISSTSCLRSVLKNDKLLGNNFLSWYRNLRIILTQEKKLYVLEQPLPAPPTDDAPRAEKDAYSKHHDDVVNVGYLMLVTMDLELQKQHENMGAYDMIVHLSQFVMNYNMSKHNKPLPELFNMLRTAEQDISKGLPVLMVQGTKKKFKGKSKSKKAKGASKYDLGAMKPKAKVAKDDYCFQCDNTGHWKRNCKDLRSNRSLAKGEVDLRVGNGPRTRPCILWKPNGSSLMIQT